MSSTTTTDDEFLAACRQALGGAPGDPLAQLGWWELLGDLDDPEARVALFALFHAQGLELAGTGALSGLLAAPFLADANHSGSVAATVSRHSVRRGTVTLVVGDTDAEQFLVDRPGAGVSIVAERDVTRRRIDVPGGLALYEIDFDPARATSLLEEDDAHTARARSRYFGRVALAFEMLGAAEAAVGLATEYSTVREQFGTPIGTFQAVRHLLAWALTDCAAIAAVSELARDLWPDPPARFDEIAKALAGRNARRASQRTLQVLGGIGFTAEHDHHLFYSRVLVLDSLLGSSAELTAGLGAWVHTDRPDLRLAQRALLG
jgi:Acyl-CoA dehydrogenase, C-terminal domain